MQNTDASARLKQLIVLKEAEHELEGALLKLRFQEAYENIKPINIIKNAIKKVITSPDLKNNLVNSAIGLSSGFVAKKVFTGGSHNPITKLFGVILEKVIAGKVTANADEIKVIAKIMVGKLIKRKTDPGEI
jgi:ribosomal protein L29